MQHLSPQWCAIFGEAVASDIVAQSTSQHCATASTCVHLSLSLTSRSHAVKPAISEVSCPTHRQKHRTLQFMFPTPCRHITSLVLSTDLVLKHRSENMLVLPMDTTHDHGLVMKEFRQQSKLNRARVSVKISYIQLARMQETDNASAYHKECGDGVQQVPNC